MIAKIEMFLVKMGRAFRLMVGAWTPPIWMMPLLLRISAFYQKRRLLIWKIVPSVLCAGGIAYGGYLYYESLPKPETCAFRVSLSPSPVDPAYPSETASSIVVAFDCGAARLDLLDKELTADQVKISPEIKGTWKWANARDLVFQPSAPAGKNDWVRGQKYEIEFTKHVIASHIRVPEYETSFKVGDFSVTIDDPEFYIDPVVETNKRARMTVRFNSPVDTESFKSRVSGEYVKVDKALSRSSKKSDLQIRFNAYNTEAYLLSEQLETPRLSGSFFFRIKSGVTAVVGGPALKRDIEKKLDIPGKKGSFRIDSARAVIAKDENFEPQSTLVVETNLGINSEEIAKQLKVWLLPRDNPDDTKYSSKRPYPWSSSALITPAVRKLMKPVEIKLNASVTPQPKMHSFKLAAAPQQYIHVEIPSGLVAYGGYESDTDFASVDQVPEIPKEISIMGEGMLLSLSGERKLSVLARGIGKGEIEISRALPERMGLVFEALNSYDSLKSPHLYESMIDKTSVRTVEKIELGSKESTSPFYYAVDFNKFLPSNSTLGLFHVRIQSAEGGPSTERMVLLTDMGVVGKKTTRGTFDIFVQSIRNGEPVPDATIEAIGQNGEPVFTSKTDERGHGEMPDISLLTREKRVVFFLVRKGADISFLYPNMVGQNLNFSRFDISGEYETSDSDALTTMIFSDRGLYRPGDDIHFGLITRSKNLKKSFHDVSVNWSFVDPTGIEVNKGVTKISAGSLGELNLKTFETSAVGTYTLSVFIVRKNQTQDVLGTQTVRIDEFQTDRMRNLTTLSKNAVEGWVSPAGLTAAVNLQNLFGSPAGDRRISGRVVVSPQIPYFPSYKGWTFSNINPADEMTFTEDLGDGKTKEDGTFEWELPLAKYVSGMYRLTVYTDGFEASGGRSVSGAATTLMSPLPYLLGLKSSQEKSYITAGSPQDIEVISVSPQAKPIAIKDLKVELVEIKYVSVLQKRGDDTYAYQSTMKEDVIDSKTIELDGKSKKMPLKTDVPGDYVLIFKNKDGQELNRHAYSVAGEKNLAKRLDRNSELRLVLDKHDYEKNGTIEMQIRAPYAGAGLITIERDQVYAFKWFKSATTNTVQTIQVPSGLEGNAYVTVTYLRDRDSTEVFSSPLSFATAPFSISRKSFVTDISLKSPVRVKPGEKLKIEYQTSQNADIVIYGVDEGILQVAKYKLPNPLDFFFRKRALQVVTMQVLDLFLPEYSLIKGSAPGGDSDSALLAKNLNPFKRKSQPPVVFWSGILKSTPQLKTYEYSVPDYYNGNVKIMAVTTNPNGMGSSEVATVVRGDIVITPTAPLFASPNDQFEFHVAVTNQQDGSGKSSPISLHVDGGSAFKIEGEAKHSLSVDEGREGSFAFKVTTLNKLGSSPLVVTATGTKGVAKMSIQVGVRPATPYKTVTQMGIEKSLPISLDTNEVHHDEFRKKIFSVAVGPIALSSALKEYLDDYPYGCTEQLLSRAFPGLLAKTRAILNISKKDEQKYFDEALRTLRSRQTSSGGFGLHSGHEVPSPFISLYSLFYLTEAKAQGYAVPQDMVDRGIAYAEQTPLEEHQSLENIRYGAMARYLLARNGRVPKTDIQGFITRARKHYKEALDKDIAAAYLAATYKILNMDAEAERLIKAVPAVVKQVSALNPYYDELVHSSTYLYLIAKHFPTEVSSLVKTSDLETIVDPVKRRLYHSLSAAQLMMAFEALYEAAGATGGFSHLKLFQKGPNGETSENLKDSFFQRSQIAFATTGVRLAGLNSLPVYYSMIESGFDRVPAATPVEKNIEVSRAYLIDGKAVSTVQQGDEVEVHVRARATVDRTIPDIALVDLFPAGFELVFEPTQMATDDGDGSGRADDESSGEEHGLEYDEGDGEEGDGANLRDFLLRKVLGGTAFAQSNAVGSMFIRSAERREDRVVIYTSLNKELVEYVYRLKAVSIGRYVVPPTFGEGMYDREVYYRGVASQIEIKAK